MGGSLFTVRSEELDIDQDLAKAFDNLVLVCFIKNYDKNSHGSSVKKFTAVKSYVWDNPDAAKDPIGLSTITSLSDKHFFTPTMKNVLKEIADVGPSQNKKTTEGVGAKIWTSSRRPHQ